MSTDFPLIVTLRHDYLRYGTGAFADYQIFQSIQKAREASGIDSRVDDSWIRRNQIDADLHLRLFSALALESYAAFLLETTEKKIQNTRDWQKERGVEQQIAELLAVLKDTEPDTSREPYQSMKWISLDRNELVHDKAKPVTSLESLDRGLSGLSPIRILSALSGLGRETENLDAEFRFLNDLEKARITDWLSNNYPYSPDQNSLYSEARFPSEFRYCEFVRKHTGGC